VLKFHSIVLRALHTISKIGGKSHNKGFLELHGKGGGSKEFLKNVPDKGGGKNIGRKRLEKYKEITLKMIRDLEGGGRTG